MLEINRFYRGDCLETMKEIDAQSIDMILCDLPYGTTACKWDTVIPFEPLWGQYKRVIKDNGAIVLTAAQPFTSALVMSNPRWFRYEWIWEKGQGVNPLSAKQQPLRKHEQVLVFGPKSPVYYPQMGSGTPYGGFESQDGAAIGEVYNKGKSKHRDNPTGERYPTSILKFSRERGLHPTQKPIALFEYLIKTYTKSYDLVLDNCAGSGTTGIACLRTKRNFILIEKEEKYCEIIQSRLEKEEILVDLTFLWVRKTKDGADIFEIYKMSGGRATIKDYTEEKLMELIEGDVLMSRPDWRERGWKLAFSAAGVWFIKIGTALCPEN